MTIKYGHRIIMLTTTAVIGFAALSIVFPANVRADENFSEDEFYENQDISEDMEDEILERQRSAMSELEKLKADTRVTRDSMVDTTTGPQNYFEGQATPQSTGDASEEGAAKKVYQYDKTPDADKPQRLFNNVR